MANIIAEGFATYGLGNADAVRSAMLSGAWADLPPSAQGSGIATLPWDSADSDLFFYANNVQRFNNGWARRVLPNGAVTTCIVSMYFATDALPSSDNGRELIRFHDGSNVDMAQVVLRSTGDITLYNGDKSVLLLSSASPVIVAEAATHLEMKITPSTGSFDLYVNQVHILTGAGLAMGANNIAQLAFFTVPIANSDAVTFYMSNLIVRDATGSVNNDIVGDRRVATLMVNNDDPAHQGWTGFPLHKFGNGIFDNTDVTTVATLSAGLTAVAATDTNLGVGDFTIEGFWRFKALPPGSGKAVLFGKWNETSNNRSYQLYLGGSTLDAGQLCFRTSTDGLAGSVVQKILWPYEFVLGEYYHIAVVRASGEDLLFINGQQQGLPIADAATYFAGSARTCLGFQFDSLPISATQFQGWEDEFRLTVGFARYTSNFVPTVVPFPRNVGGDPQFAMVKWLSGWDSGLFDESSVGRALTSVNGAKAVTPDDGVANYQVLNKQVPPLDDTFIEASLLPAVGLFTLAANATTTKIVTVGTKTGPAAAVYTFKTALASAFDVLIGASIQATITNLMNAIIHGPGEGTTYGTGTTSNLDVTANILPSFQLQVTAITPGSAGNSVASTTNDPNGSWGHATLQGGVDIPPYSQFNWERPPSNTTIIDSVTIVNRVWKTDAGPAKFKQSFIGPLGGLLDGTEKSLTTVPTLYFDTFETDPDTAGPVTPSTVVSGKMKINRTV